MGQRAKIGKLIGALLWPILAEKGLEAFFLEFAKAVGKTKRPEPFPDSLDLSMRELERIWPRGKFTLPTDWGDLSPDRDAEPIKVVGGGPEPSFEDLNRQLFGEGHGPHFEDIPEH